MPEVIDFHDLTIESFLVEAFMRRVRLSAIDAHALEAPRLVAEFTDVSVYCLSGDLLGTIVFELEERDPLQLYKQFAEQLQAAFRANGGHAPWVATEAEASSFLAASASRGFELSSSTGGAAAIWCRGFQKRAEPKSGLTSA